MVGVKIPGRARNDGRWWTIVKIAVDYVFFAYRLSAYFAGSRDREFPNSLKNAGLGKARLPLCAGRCRM